MNYLAITENDTSNGEGIRTVLWVAGCEHNCPGCHNPESHDFNAGEEFTEEILDDLLTKCDHNYISGLTISGGDPLNIKNAPVIMLVCHLFKERFPDKTIWIYTGFTIEELLVCSQFRYSDLLKYVDVLVDGPFIRSLYSHNLEYRGSSNQRILLKEDINKFFNAV